MKLEKYSILNTCFNQDVFKSVYEVNKMRGVDIYEEYAKETENTVREVAEEIYNIESMLFPYKGDENTKNTLLVDLSTGIVETAIHFCDLTNINAYEFKTTKRQGDVFEIYGREHKYTLTQGCGIHTKRKQVTERNIFVDVFIHNQMTKLAVLVKRNNVSTDKWNEIVESAVIGDILLCDVEIYVKNPFKEFKKYFNWK